MLNIKIMEYQFIFISGTVGVGKSTIIDKLMDEYENKPCLIKEYIDFDYEGAEKLDKFLLGVTSAFEFQKYVVDCAFSQFIGWMNNPNKPSNIVIWERHPMESLIFAAQRLTIYQMERLYNYIFNLCQSLGVPLPSECHFVEIKNGKNAVYNQSRTEKICKSIMNSKTQNPNMIVHLSVDDKQQTKNLLSRGRPSDKGYLMEKGMEYLRKINLTYSLMPTINYDIRPETFYQLFRYDYVRPEPLETNY